MAARGTAYARAALAGNPSDGYGGAVLAVTIDSHRAEVAASVAPQLSVDPPSRLVEAAVRRFARERTSSALRTALRWRTSVPRGVGMGGSSAIVIATLRALCKLHGETLGESELANCALAVENDDLGIAAGLQDRVAQAYGGLTFMDFGEPLRYERLDRAQLPPLVIAWRTVAAADSGRLHSQLRTRFTGEAGELRAAMRELGGLAWAARDALLSGELDQFGRCVDHTFDVRRRIMELDPRHVEMIEIARRFGASANYTGSGGAVVAVCRDEEHQHELADAMRERACDVVPRS